MGLSSYDTYIYRRVLFATSVFIFVSLSLLVFHLSHVYSLDHSHAIGHIQRIIVLAQSHVALFQSPRCNQRIHFFTFNLIQFFHRRLDLSFIGFNVNNKNERIGIFNQFHGTFGRQWILDNAMLIQMRLFGCTGTNIFGFAGCGQRFGTVKVNARVNASALFGNAMFQGFGYSRGLVLVYKYRRSAKKRV